MTRGAIALVLFSAVACGGAEVETGGRANTPQASAKKPAPPHPTATRDPYESPEAAIAFLLNLDVIRAHPVGAKTGSLLAAIPPWSAFTCAHCTGENASYDMLRDNDWILWSGSGAVKSSQDTVFIGYRADDRIVANAIDRVAKSTPDSSSIDVGVPGVDATKLRVFKSERVVLREQEGVIAIVDPKIANATAHALATAKVARTMHDPHEAIRMRIRDPHASFKEIPAVVREGRFWVTGHDDGGAEIVVEGDCANEADAALAAEDLAKSIRRANTLPIRLVTRGLFNEPEISVHGTVATMHVLASREQLEALGNIVAATFNTTLDGTDETK